MNLEKDKVAIGYIQKSHGILGDLILRLYDKDGSFLEKGLFLFIKGSFFSLESFREHKANYIVRLKGVSSRTEADLLKGSEVFVSVEAFHGPSAGDSESQFYLFQLLGFEVFLGKEKKGKIIGFSSTKAHELIRVGTQETWVEIPWVDSFVKECSLVDKCVVLDCPEELFDASFFNSSV